MGRCLCFNFCPQELKAKLKEIKYFVYSPDYDSAGYSDDQHFYTEIDVAKRNPENIIRKIERSIRNSRLSFFAKDGRLYVSLYSLEPYCAVTDDQIADVEKADQVLSEMGVVALPYNRNQDVVFGEKHLLAKEFLKPFVARGAFSVPTQDGWFCGQSYEEVRDLYHRSSKK